MTPALDTAQELWRNFLDHSWPRADTNARLMAILGGAGASIIGGKLLSDHFRASQQALPAKNFSDRAVLRAMNAPRDISVYRPADAGTAYYMPSEYHALGNLGKRVTFRPVSKAEEKDSKTGSISLSKDMRRPAILAHEAGHAIIGARPWWSPSRFNQSVLRSNFLLPVLAQAGAMRAGSVLGASPSFSSSWTAGGTGAATGALMGLLGGLPTLTNEWQATGLAKDWLRNKSSLSPKEVEASEKALNRAFLTYLGAHTLAPAVSGGLIAGLSKNRW